MNDRKIRVFIIDTEIDLCLLMKTYLLRKNYEVYISHSCIDAFPRVKEYQPSIIFLSSAACENPEKDIKKIKELALNAETIIDNYRLPGKV